MNLFSFFRKNKSKGTCDICHAKVPTAYYASCNTLPGVQTHYFANTVCSLIRKMQHKGENPTKTQIFENLKDTLVELEPKYWRTADGRWHNPRVRCQRMCKRYWDPADGTKFEYCQFRDGAKTILFET